MFFPWSKDVNQKDIIAAGLREVFMAGYEAGYRRGANTPNLVSTDHEAGEAFEIFYQDLLSRANKPDPIKWEDRSPELPMDQTRVIRRVPTPSVIESDVDSHGNPLGE